MHARTRADLFRNSGFSNPALARAYFDVVTGSAGKPRTRKHHPGPALTVAIALVALAILAFAGWR